MKNPNGLETHRQTIPVSTRRLPRAAAWLTLTGRQRRPRQRRFRFVERTERLARRFKLGILLGTAMTVFTAVAATSSGRNAAGWLATRPRVGACSGWWASRRLARRSRRTGNGRRLHEIEQTKAKLRSTYAEYGTSMQRLLDYAGLDPDHALLRWGNFDRTLYLPSTVFQADETGRSYRFRAGVRSIWVRNLKLKGGILAYFPVPQSEPACRDRQGDRALVVDSSVQTINSWGPARARTPTRTHRSGVSCWATRTCRACSSATIRRPANA